MAAGIYNFTIEQGTTFTRTFKYKDSEGNPIDLVSGDGFTARMEIKDKIGGNTTHITLSSTLSLDNTGLDFAEASSGKIKVFISANSSSQLPISKFSIV